MLSLLNFILSLCRDSYFDLIFVVVVVLFFVRFCRVFCCCRLFVCFFVGFFVFFLGGAIMSCAVQHSTK